MNAYILKGDPQELDKVIRENRIRINRGVISITPVEPGTFSPDNYDNLKDEVGEVLSIAVESGAELPEDLSERLSKHGIIVPKIEETAENPAFAVPNSAEIVPETVDAAPEIDTTPAAMDDKNIVVEDLQEVDLDADDKNPATDDTKDVQEADAKEVDAPKKTSKRGKKSE